MPALLEDPTSPVVYRSSGPGPYPTPTNPQIPSSIFPRPVTLRDRVTIATLIPFFSHEAVPSRLLQYLCDNLNKEIEDGNTYPMINPLPLATFGPYWFGNFGAVMVQGDIGGIEAVNEMERTGADWAKLCLGSFYVKPNYPGRSSHVCNGGFLVTPAARNKGVGKSMGQCYLDWAPQLGYTYSVFNLVYETNTASTRIWDSLGFKRIGRVPACGNLKSYSEPVDAIIYGRDLKAEEGNVGNEERFDKIRYYLRHSLYPQGADRSEKSRLRSAATHYKLIPAADGVPEKLMLKDKEVISDPNQQYEIAKTVHLQSHGGINKTTAIIATQYHWVRIKETASHVIKNCPECKDTNKPPATRPEGPRAARSKTLDGQSGPPEIQQNSSQNQITGELQSVQIPDDISSGHIGEGINGPSMPDAMHQTHLAEDDYKPTRLSANDYHPVQQPLQLHAEDTLSDNDPQMYDDMAIDPQIMEQIQAQLAEYDTNQQHQFLPPNLTQYADTSHMSPPHNHAPNHGHGHSHGHGRTHQGATDYSQAGPNHLDGHAAHFMATHAPAQLGRHPNPSLDQLMSGGEDTSGRASAQSMPGPSSNLNANLTSALGPSNGPSSLGGPLRSAMPGGPGQGQSSTSSDGSGMNDMQQMRHVLQMEYMGAPTHQSQAPNQNSGAESYKQ